MRYRVDLLSPSEGTGWRDTWSFSGSEATALQAELAKLEEFRVPDPQWHWDAKTHQEVCTADDRWLAAMILYPGERSEWAGLRIPPAEAAWSSAGALRLAKLLPETFADLKGDILKRFEP